MVTGPSDRGNSSIEELFPGDAMPCLQKLIFADGFQGCDSSEDGLPGDVLKAQVGEPHSS